MSERAKLLFLADTLRLIVIVLLLASALSSCAGGGSAGTPLEDIPGAMQVRSCDSTLWRPLATGLTGRGVEAGVGEIDFTFVDNKRNCEYRIVAPFDAAPLPELFVLLQTLTFKGDLAGN